MNILQLGFGFRWLTPEHPDFSKVVWSKGLDLAWHWNGNFAGRQDCGGEGCKWCSAGVARRVSTLRWGVEPDGLVYLTEVKL